jgi:hypothetical protein
MADLKIKFVGGKEDERQLDPQAALTRVKGAMDVVIADAASLLAEASPVGVYAHMQGAWLQTQGVEVTAASIMGYSDPTPTAPYAWYVIFGRGPGKMPPPQALLPWVWKKLGVTGFRARSVAWNIARKIGRKGTKPNDFVTPIVRKNEPLWRNILTKAAMPPEA